MQPTDPTQQDQQPDPTQVLQATNAALLKKKKLAEQQNESYSPAQISQAMAIANPNGKSAPIQVGKAISSGNYAGWCLKWVDDQQGTTNRQPNAYTDYQANASQGNINTSTKIPANARVYFAPDDSNQGQGHVGISNGDGTFTSATDNGIKTFALKDWEKYTGQQYIGYSTTKS